MPILRRLLLTALTWLVVSFILICVVLIPRQIEYVATSNFNVHQSYEFSMTAYKHSLSSFFSYAWEHKSLGLTKYNLTVEEEIKRYVPRSFKLIVTALILGVILGIAKGIFDFQRAQRGSSFWGNGMTWFFQSLPDFFIVIIVQYLLLKLVMGTSLSFSIYGYDKGYSFLLPSILLSIYPIVYIARITSASLAGQVEQPYIQTAKSKGLTERVVLYKHMLGNCWGAILTHISSIMIFLLSNLLIVEYLSYYRGAAYRLYEAFGNHDSSIGNIYRVGQTAVYESELIIGLLLVFMLLILFTQWISQVAKFYLEPQGRGEKG